MRGSSLRMTEQPVGAIQKGRRTVRSAMSAFDPVQTFDVLSFRLD